MPVSSPIVRTLEFKFSEMIHSLASERSTAGAVDLSLVKCLRGSWTGEVLEQLARPPFECISKKQENGTSELMVPFHERRGVDEEEPHKCGEGRGQKQHFVF